MLEKLKEEWRSSPRLGRVVAATLDVAFYLLHLTTHKPASVYDLAILLLLDSYIKAGHDKTGRMKMFYHLPKVFLMSPGQSLVGFVFALALIASHVREIWPLKNTYIFFLSITAGVSISSTGITRMLALGLVAFIMASYMYIWEADQLALTPSKPAEQLSESDVNEETQKDNAIAENLITKLKKLKVALIIENERPKLNVMEEEVEGLRRGRSDKDNLRSENSHSEGEDAAIKLIRQTLTVQDVKSLIEILLSHNSQEMKYWLPKDILSVLNNEEVSAYLLAYLNTQDMIPSPRSVKKNSKSNRKQKRDDSESTAGIGVDFNFDLFAFDKLNLHQNSLVVGCSEIYKKFNILEGLNNCPEAVMTSFLESIQAHYFNNFYHNSIHGICVTNSCAFYLRCGLGTHLTNLDILTFLISATVHDVGHPGFNNAFMVSINSKQALIYNDQSVLENYHCSLTFQILQKEKSNIIKNLSPTERNYFRKTLINNVLSTDLSKHYLIIKKFESAIGAEFNMNDEQNKHMAMAVAIKCADVGHSAKALDLHKIWSRRVTEEFWNQGDLELKHQIPLTQLCDRKNNIAKSQDGFLSFFALPLFEGFGKFLQKYSNG